MKVIVKLAIGISATFLLMIGWYLTANYIFEHIEGKWYEFFVSFLIFASGILTWLLLERIKELIDRK